MVSTRTSLVATVVVFVVGTLLLTTNGCKLERTSTPTSDAPDAPADAPAGPTATVRGRIVGAGGSVPRLAHVRFEGGETAGDDVEASRDDGTFAVAVPVGVAGHLVATAVDHEATEVPVLLESEAEAATVEIRLAANPFLDEIEEPKVVGEWNDFAFSAAEAMERQPDGTWVWEKGDVEGETLGYELVGITSNGHSVNGTDSDVFESDGWDYKSVVAVVDGRARVVLDPAKLPRAGEGEPGVGWDEAHTHLTEIHRTTARIDEVAAADRSEEVGEDEARAAAEELARELEGRATDETVHPLLASWAAVRRLALESVEIDDELRTRLVAAAPPEAPAWAFAPHAVAAVDDDVRWAEIVERNPDRRVRGHALVELVRSARDAGDEARWTELHGRLASDYGDVRELRFWIGDLDPKSPTRIGRTVPSFRAKLLDGTEISDESLRGRWVLLDFWATWCGPCVAEMPNLDEVWKRHGGDSFEIVSFSFDNERAEVDEFRRDEWAMPWKHVFVDDGFESDLAKAFAVEGIPKPVLVAPDGTIAAVEEELREKALERTLAAKLGAAKS